MVKGIMTGFLLTKQSPKRIHTLTKLINAEKGCDGCPFIVTPDSHVENGKV
jgi:hypothetical protein